MQKNDKTNPSRHRPVRSFVLRKGRLTSAQQHALDELWPHYGIDKGDGVLDFAGHFGRTAELVLDIGFGNGESTWQMAQAEPDINFVGIEVHPPGVGQLLMALDKYAIENVRVVRDDVVDFLRQRVAPGSIKGVRIYFPDPWPKKRHHKRRIIQPDFVAELARCMASGGLLHLATDWQNYAEHMLEVMAGSPDFVNLSGNADYVERPRWRPHTKYEKRGERLGHVVRDMLYRRK
ncbi:MAG: tRNA (guanosine(46)-N7)-methyltransferase TrmB [Xanthomonadales bacterium]|nr:tRNA (guanosine(46)-N7)-methyltransferase TrmB [Xanthomonadales bacterium]